MKKIIIKNKIKSKKGFVLLFAVMISSIILAVSLGVANIAYKEVKFGTSAKDTNDAFLASDTGAECALNYDKSVVSSNAFTGTAGPNISCAGASITISGSSSPWSFIIPGLGSLGQGCAKVTVTKTSSTSIVSKGYNTGSPSCTPGSNTVERELDVTY